MRETRATTIGFFGKMPAHGDFVSRGLSPGLVSHWDDWLGRGLAASMETLHTRWLDHYLSGPIWRFALAAGLISEEAWLGVMLPSVDRVGRYFPLTGFGALDADRSLWATAIAAEQWHDALERALLNALEQDTVDAAALAQQLTELPTLTLAPLLPRNVPSAGAITLARDLDHPLAALSAPLLETLAAARYGRFSIWWTTGSEFVAPRIDIYAGLPEAGRFWTLFGDA